MKKIRFTAIAFLDDEKIISGDNNGQLSVWWIKTGKLFRHISFLDSEIKTIKVSGNQILCKTVDNSITLWNYKNILANTDNMLPTFRKYFEENQFDDDDTYNEVLYQYDIGFIDDVAVRIKYISSYKVEIIDLKSDEMLVEFESYDIGFEGIAAKLSQNGDFLLSSVSLWHIPTGKCISNGIDGYGDDLCLENDDLNLTSMRWDIFMSNNSKLQAFVDSIIVGYELDLEENDDYYNDYFFVRIYQVDFNDKLWEYNEFGWDDGWCLTAQMGVGNDVHSQFRIHKDDILTKDDMLTMALNDDHFATITNSGNIKIYYMLPIYTEHKDYTEINYQNDEIVTINSSEILEVDFVKNNSCDEYNDLELSQLKLELKSLESRLQELIEQKTEYLNDLEEFNREYNIRLGGIIRDILNLRKEILNKKIIQQQNLKTKYQEDLQTFEETQATIEELKSSIDEFKEVLDLIDEDHENYEEILTAYNELNAELDKLEQELSEQETELEKTKEFLDDDELFQQYEEARSSSDEFDESYEYIKEFQKDKIELGNEEKAELKKLFRKAARLCHPDIVPDELKEQATHMMQQLNAAYDKQDLAQVRKILDSLENGSGFDLSSDRIEDKEKLKDKIQEYKENIAHIELEIEEILQDETYQTISALDDWDAYFEELKKDLEAEKQKLKEEAKYFLEEKEEFDLEEMLDENNNQDDEYNSVPSWMHTLWEWADINNIISGKIPRKADYLFSLRVLDLTGQKLNYLPDEIVNLQNVTEISLWDCGLRYLPKKIVEFRSLKKLNLRTNPELMLTSAQEEWIEDLKRSFCIVYKDSTLAIGDIDYNEIRKQSSDTSKKVPLTTFDEQSKIILDWMVAQFQKIYKVDLTKEYKAYIRAKDTANQVVRDLQNKGSSKIELRYLVNKIDFVVKYVDYETFGIVSSTKPKKTVQEAPQSKAKPTQETPKKILSESSPYANHIKSIEVPNFEKIRRYCNNLTDENKADKMQEYLAENGRMHKAIIYDALEQFIEQLKGKEITLVDWGCGQGITSMLVLDYIREKQLDVKVKNVTLIDYDVKTLGRAMAQVEALKEKSVVIEAIDVNSGSIQERIQTLKAPIVHLFVNDTIPIDLSNIHIGTGYALGLSHQSAKSVDSVCNAIKGTQISKRDGKIGRFQRFERILKVNQ